MTPIKTALIVLPLILSTLFIGCGWGGHLPTIPVTTTPSVTLGTGNWYFSGLYFLTPNNVVPYYIGGSLINNNGQLSGVFHINQSCFGNYETDIPYTGTLDSKYNLNIISSPIDGQVLTLHGLLSTNGLTLSEATFAITGGCSGNIVGIMGPDGPGATFDPTGVRLPILNGSWVTAPNAGYRIDITEQLAQSPAPDPHGDYALTGTISLTGAACFTQGTLQPASFISGYLGRQLILMNDGSVFDATLQVSPPVNSLQPGLYLSGQVTGGKCNGQLNVSLL